MKRKGHPKFRILATLLATVAAYVLLYWILHPEDGPGQSFLFLLCASIAVIIGVLTMMYFVIDWLLPKRRS